MFLTAACIVVKHEEPKDFDVKLNLTFQQGPVLSPLRDSPLQAKDETSKSLQDPYFNSTIFYFSRRLTFEVTMPDFRCPEDFPDSQMTNVPYTNTTSKSTEEEKSQIPKKVGIIVYFNCYSS